MNNNITSEEESLQTQVAMFLGGIFHYLFSCSTHSITNTHKEEE